MILKELGWQVTGSDENFYPPVSTYLENSGIKFFKGYRKENIPGAVNMFVIGRHAGLTPEENPEVRAAFAAGRPVKSFAEVLGDLTKNKESVIVAGSYGKSTCAALLAWCLECTGRKPGYFIGAIPTTPAKSSHAGQGKIFVLEGDEYPSANWDSRSKFLHYRPKHLLLTSLAHDHLNVFKTAADYRAPFKKLIELVPAQGTVAACADGDDVKQTLKALGREAVFYGVKDNKHWGIKNIEYGERSSFDIIHNGKKVIGINTGLLGKHNMENVLGVGALLLTLGLIRPKQFSQAVAEFKPLQRRLDKKSEKTRILVYEGFGSSRDKARAAIEAVKLHFPGRRLAVLFEPHSFSWRSPQALTWYDAAFAGADKVLIYRSPVLGGFGDQLSLAEIITRVRKAKIDAASFKSAAEGSKLLEKFIGENWLVLVLSSGGFAGIIQPLVNWLERKFPA